jgi:hypothetical protein
MQSPQSRLMNDFVAGTVGGLVGTALNTPFDVVKSRIQGAAKVPGVVPKYGWSYPSLVLIAREEGLRALYKGFVPKVLRLAPGGGVLLLVVEATLGFFRQGTSSLVRSAFFAVADVSYCLLSSRPTLHLKLVHCYRGLSLFAVFVCLRCSGLFSSQVIYLGSTALKTIFLLYAVLGG